MTTPLSNTEWTYQPTTHGWLGESIYHIIQYLDSFPTISHLELDAYLDHITLDPTAPYQLPFPPCPDEDTLIHNCLKFHQTTTLDLASTNPTNTQPFPPQAPPSLLSAMELDEKFILRILQRFAATFQPQPLLSLYAFCLHSLPTTGSQAPRDERLGLAWEHMKKNMKAVDDVALLNDLVNIVSRSSIHTYDTYSILLNILFTKTTVYSQALYRSNPCGGGGDRGGNEIGVVAGGDDDLNGVDDDDGDGDDDGPIRLRTHAINVSPGTRSEAEKAHKNVAENALSFTTPLPFYFVKLGLKSSLLRGHTRATMTLVSLKLAADLVKTCCLHDDVDLFVAATHLIIDIAASGDLSLPSSEFWEWFVMDLDMTTKLVLNGCYRILKYVISHHNNLFITRLKSRSTAPLEALTTFTLPSHIRNNREQLRMVYSNGNVERYRQTATLLFSFEPVRQHFIQTTIKHNTSSTASRQHDTRYNNNTDRYRMANTKGSMWDLCLRDQFYPCLDILHTILLPSLPNPKDRFSALDLVTYLGEDIPGLCGRSGGQEQQQQQPQPLLRLQLAWDFILDEVLVPNYKLSHPNHSPSLTSPTTTNMEVKSNNNDHIILNNGSTSTPSPSSPSSSIITTTPIPSQIPSHPNQPIQISPHSFPTFFQMFRGWYFWVYSKTFPDPRTIMDQDVTSLEWSRRLPPNPPLIFILLFSPPDLTLARLPSLLSRRKEYPINLYHILKPEPTSTWTRIKPFSLTPIQFTILRPTLLGLSNLGPRINNYTLNPPITRTPSSLSIEQDDQHDSIVIELLLDYYVESILDHTVDITHQPMMTIIKC